MAEDQAGGDQGAQAPPAPDPSAVSSPPPSPQGGGGGTLPPQGAPGSQQVEALGAQAMARGIMRNFMHIVHTKVFPAFELNSDEGKAVHKILSAGAMFAGGGKEDGDSKNSAMAALMQRAMQARAGGAGGAGGGQPGMPQPNRGPVPTMAGTQ